MELTTPLPPPPPPLGQSSTARPALRAGAHRAARFTGRRKEEAARRTGGRRARAPAVRKSRGAGREEEEEGRRSQERDEGRSPGMEMEDGYDSGDGGPRRQEMVRAEAD